jgi:phosphoribosylaminoimidazolecarboxamide formyltransferase/IMP cyclohydrolase
MIPSADTSMRKGKAVDVSQTGEGLPERISGSIAKKSDLRYGENPHQRGALYVMPGQAEGIAASEILHGMDMSYLNYVDADAAWRAVWDFEEPTCVIVKHATPCGLASHQEPSEAYARALAGDPISAYGGIVALNRPVDARVAETIRNIRNPLTGKRQLLHVVVAPGFSDEGLATLMGKSKDLRILRAPPPPRGGLRLRQISGGWLVQDDDDLSADEFEFEPVSQRHPTQAELADLVFAWKACKHITSNAIAVAKDRVLVGAGAGQPNRVGSVKLALEAAGDRAHGSVMASDAYFPFTDGVEVAAAAGIAAVVQPTGSLRDAEVMAAANRHGLALVVARRRHFRH